MKKILSHLFEHRTLSKHQSKEVLTNIASGNYNNSQVAAFMTVFMMRNIAVDELEGFRDALIELCVKVDFSDFKTIDVCGTGGDGKDTFNISTLSAFVLAGAGIKVAKHGNYSASSICGSSNVLEHLGYKFSDDQDLLKSQLDKAGICILHAPLFHPALKNVAPIRKELGVKTFFNMLGPLVNPAFPNYKYIGVFNLETARIYNYLLQKENKPYTIVHSLDGYDEISLTGSFKLLSNNKEELIAPQNIGLEAIEALSISGGNSIKDAADIFMKIIKGEGTKEQNDVVITNTAFAIQCAESITYEKAVEKAEDSLYGKKAYSSLKKLIEGIPNFKFQISN